MEMRLNMTEDSALTRPDPCCFVLFGATGDLAQRLVIPALYNLAASGLLPEPFAVLGVTRRDVFTESLRTRFHRGPRKFATQTVHDDIACRLFEKIIAVSADVEDEGSFERLRDALQRREGDWGTKGNRLFYLATPPGAFAPTANELGRLGLTRQEDAAWRRLVVEKPFGVDLASAPQLNAQLLQTLSEHQIYRIDHYLGKETVQNLLVLRFANGMFEPLWNREHIEHVEIRVDGTLSVGQRGRFYDATGALRDMVPNHLFQLLSLVTMEPPARFDAHTVRAAKAAVLSAIQPQTPEQALRNSVRGHYMAGQAGEYHVPDYRETEDVARDSQTETYVALRLMIDNWRWAGVPLYLRTGKALARKCTEIAIKFRTAPLSMFKTMPVADLADNYLVIGIDPVERISLQFNAKVPGLSISIRGVQMDFCYRDYFRAQPKTGYETLLYDCVRGDNLLFQCADSIEAGWRDVEPFLQAWRDAGHDGLTTYVAGSDGPDAAKELLAREVRRWREAD
ncbi:MAG: zwf [Hyphomicrobiales bacterium]|nr:zwf [Hyphomicrobiales bacterium]